MWSKFVRRLTIAAVVLVAVPMYSLSLADGRVLFESDDELIYEGVIPFLQTLPYRLDDETFLYTLTAATYHRDMHYGENVDVDEFEDLKVFLTGFLTTYRQMKEDDQ